MKKITLLFGLSIVSLIGFAQQTNETLTISESIERETEYIIVLDDVAVDGNIDMLLNGNHISESSVLNFNMHELVHDAPGSIDIESKFVEGAYSYNEYAVNYTNKIDTNPSLGS